MYTMTFVFRMELLYMCVCRSLCVFVCIYVPSKTIVKSAAFANIQILNFIFYFARNFYENMTIELKDSELCCKLL